MTQAQNVVENNRAQAGLQMVQHPSDLGPFFLSMDFYDYRAAFGQTASPHNSANNISPVRRLFNADRTSVDNQIKKSSFAKIKLPIPANLSDNYRTQWEDIELGGFAGIASDIYATTGALINAGGLNENAGGGSGEEGEAGGASGIILAALRGTAQGIGRQLINETTIGNIFDLATGTAVNQNLTVAFRGPTLKSHQFKWRLAPKTVEESNNIKKIIGIVKRAKHASQFASESTTILRYPSECLLMFVSASPNAKDFLYPMRPCVLVDFSINYAPNGGLSLHQGDGYNVTVVEISMTFKETSYYTRESFDNTLEYGYDGLNTADLMRAGSIQYDEQGAPPLSSENPPVAPPTPAQTAQAPAAVATAAREAAVATNPFLSQRRN